MKQALFKATLISLLLFMHIPHVLATKYVIYPIPRSITMNSGSIALTEKVNVLCESTIDRITQERLKAILAVHGIETAFDSTEENNLTLRLGTVGSAEHVESYAIDSLGMNVNSIMKADRFDRHAIKVHENGITILGEHTNAVFCALASLEQMLEQTENDALQYTTIYDYADQQNRGLVEGYYGYPYSVEVKKDLMRFMMRYKMNTYMYGAKSDPYHSQMWKEAYPTEITNQQMKNGWLTQDMVKEIAQVSTETKVNFIWAIHPGNDFLGSSTVIADIMSKFEMMHSLGVRHFGVFVDDVSIPSSDADMKLNADRLTALQQAIENKWNTESATPEDTIRPLHFVPQIYCNSFASSVDQRQRFMTALSKVPSYITVYSTGQGVWSVPNNDHTNTVIQEFGRPMGWWWNYPCNDNADGQIYPMDMYSNFVDMPAIGDGERLPSRLNNCQGIVANPMQQGQVAKTSLFSIADFAWNNAGYNNETSWEASFKALISNETVRQAYHDITYYLRWNDPQSLQTLINNYKSTLEAGKPNSTSLMETMGKIRADCEKVITLKNSEVQSDRLLYADISPWLHTLHTYALITEKMLLVLDYQDKANSQTWLNVKEVSDSLAALEMSNLYTAYALEGMGNSISVSQRQAQLSRRYFYPFVSYLKAKAIDTYFQDPSAITEPAVISNSPTLEAKVSVKGGNISLSMASTDLDVNKYVGVMLPKATLIDQITLDEELLPYARYSTNGKEWNKLDSATALPQTQVGYFIFLNETEQGLKGFSLDENRFNMILATQTKAVNVTLPDGNIYDGHTAEMMVDGDYNTYTCLNRNQITQDKYILDLGAETILHDVRLCMGTVNNDYPLKGRIQYSANGKQWANLKIVGTDNYNWTIDEPQNVRYSDEMVYCDFDGAGIKARYVRLMLLSANTSKWMRLYEIEVNKQHALNSTLPQCYDGNGEALEDVTDRQASTGVHSASTSPLTYTFNRHYDVRGVTFYSILSAEQPNISVTTDGTNWENIGVLTEPCQKVNLENHPKAQAIRLEWSGNQPPSVFEIIAEYDHTTSSLPGKGSEFSEAFAQLESMAQHALDSCGYGDKLITSNSQFSSPYTQSNEGSLNNLLDGNLNTYWHSTWSGGAVNDGIHYLEIALPEGTIGDVIMHMGRRANTDGHHLIKANILGVVSGTGTSAVTELVAELDMPCKSYDEVVVRNFNLPKAYPSIRLLELQTTGSNTTGSSGFFHLGEMQLYSTQNHYIIMDAQAEADALRQAMAPLPSEATSEDYDKLMEAYEAFMYKVFGIVPSEITDVLQDGNTTGSTEIYDLSGRRLHVPSQGGIYIINGKKVIVK